MNPDYSTDDGRKMITDCRICEKSNTECRNIDLYVTGSEGLTICHDCEMALVYHVRSLMRVAAEVRLSVYKKKIEGKRKPNPIGPEGE